MGIVKRPRIDAVEGNEKVSVEFGVLTKENWQWAKSEEFLNNTRRERIPRLRD